MVMVAEQLNTDYLLVAAIIFVVTSSLLSGFLLCSMYQQLREQAVRIWGLLSSVAPVALIGTAMWSLIMPMGDALLVGVVTGVAAFAGLLLLPCGPWRIVEAAPLRLRVGLKIFHGGKGANGHGRVWTWGCDFLGGSLWGILRIAIMLAPGIWIGGAPGWLMWFALLGLPAAAVQASAPYVVPREAGTWSELGWGAAQGLVLGGLPALLLVMS
jgi:hypothetical protein